MCVAVPEHEQRAMQASARSRQIANGSWIFFDRTTEIPIHYMKTGCRYRRAGVSGLSRTPEDSLGLSYFWRGHAAGMERGPARHDRRDRRHDRPADGRRAGSARFGLAVVSAMAACRQLDAADRRREP